MDAETIANRLGQIRAAAAADDDERAHGREDDLWLDVLRAIAAGRCSNPQECAAMALMSRDIEFARWCA